MANLQWLGVHWPDGTTYALVLEKGRPQTWLGYLQATYDVAFTERGDLSPEEDRQWEAMRQARIERRRRALGVGYYQGDPHAC